MRTTKTTYDSFEEWLILTMTAWMHTLHDMCGPEGLDEDEFGMMWQRAMTPIAHFLIIQFPEESLEDEAITMWPGISGDHELGFEVMPDVVKYLRSYW